MIETVLFQAIGAVLDAFRKSAEDALQSMVLYGSLADGTYLSNQSDANLLAIVRGAAVLHDIRVAFKPVWEEYGSLLRVAPMVTTEGNLRRHLRLDPILADQLGKSRQLLAGDDCIEQLPPMEPIESLARLAHLALKASTALAAPVLNTLETERAKAHLPRLANKLGVESAGEQPVPLLLSAIQSHIGRQIQSHGDLSWPAEPAAAAHPLHDSLLATYEMEGMLILLLPDCEPQLIASIDWPKLAEKVSETHRGLRVTTPTQLRLILQIDAPADYRLMRYRHLWGQDPIAGLEIAGWRTWRDLALRPSRLQLIGLPNAYLRADDDDLSTIVHDFQNKLLNMQLRQELVARLEGEKSVVPDIPLPGRTAKIGQRIDAISDHLGWWADFYVSRLDASNADGS